MDIAATFIPRTNMLCMHTTVFFFGDYTTVARIAYSICYTGANTHLADAQAAGHCSMRRLTVQWEGRNGGALRAVHNV